MIFYFSPRLLILFVFMFYSSFHGFHELIKIMIKMTFDSSKIRGACHIAMFAPFISRRIGSLTRDSEKHAISGARLRSSIN